METTLTRQVAPHVLSVCLLAAAPGAYAVQQPEPVVFIQDYDLPQFVLEAASDQSANTGKHASVALYQELKDEFQLSHTQFASWLGLKRRSLYNWINDPSSSRSEAAIEARLVNLNALMMDMDKEHRPLLHKVAFSPIDGDPAFGEALLNGASKKELLSWYDELYEKFDLLA
ncbi:hypothetical protein [Vibrio vulnificus]|uniref:Uncharacterized protein n=1 Tax=Vibrio vulnificus TaxID=672 RepID=A0ABX4WS21_VIBVL|nr:hypothetical protein [Vibrio vulnificus]EGQ9938785.1 hypothetical protein [Vibrio vulnificus]EGR0052053.1 hypothetical protein [Vibrio vulnificus]EID4377172.1 hypothetical protein [Vibrio vulnificus]EJB0231706.1 hypothetical protein [Vibrio vulnificus]EKA7351054.1 hypothetical protein [Vibrio vulnificus]